MTTADAHGSCLEVVVLSAADAERAQLGGADGVHACSAADGSERSIEPALVSAIVRATDLPVTVTLRLSDGVTTQGGELVRLIGLASDYRSLGAARFCFGFLTRDLEIDLDVCAALADGIAGTPWIFDRTFDAALDVRRAWRHVVDIPGLEGVRTAGASLGMSAGLDELLGLAADVPDVARLAIGSGGVRPEHVPWLVRAGIRRLHVGASVRPGGSWTKAHTDPGFVRSWRLLLDDAVRSSMRAGYAG